MADMKMKRNGEGYLLTLTPGQQKKWSHLKREMQVNGLVQSKKWEGSSYHMQLGKETYTVTTTGSEVDKSFKVKVSDSTNKQVIERTYRTWECNDCIMRMLLENHNAVLANIAEQSKAQKKVAK